MARSGSIKITLKSQSAANNTSTFTVEGIITTTNGTYRGDHRTGTYNVYQGGVLVKSASFTHGAPANATTTLFSVSVTVTHDSEGKSGVITADYSYDGGWCTASSSLALTPIARASTLNLKDGALGVIQGWSINYQGSVSHKIKYTCGSLKGYLLGSDSQASTVVADNSWYPPLEWAKQEAVQTSVTVNFVLETYDGSSLIGSNSYSRTFTIPESLIPELTISYNDSEGYNTKYGGYIQNVSRIAVNIDAFALLGATIKSYSTKIDGKTYTTSSFTSEVIKTSDTLDCSCEVTDSRERTTRYEFEITVLPYAAPTLSGVSVARDSSGNKLVVTFSSKISALSNKNTAKYMIQYKKKSATYYNTAVEITTYTGNYAVSKGTYSFDADPGSSYDVKLIAYDAFNNTPVVRTGPTISMFSSRFKEGLGVAWGKIAELAETFDVGWKAIFRKDATTYDSDGTAHVVGDTLKKILASLSSYLPLSGGTMTGNLTFANTGIQSIFFSNSGSNAFNMQLYSGSSSSNYALCLYDNTNNRSVWYYTASGNFVINRPLYLNNDIVFNPGAGKNIKFLGAGSGALDVGIAGSKSDNTNALVAYDWTNDKYIWRYSAEGNFGIDVPLWCGGAVTAIGAFATASDLKSGNKDNYIDGHTGVCIVASGNIHAQHATAPSLRFYVGEGTTADNGRIYMNSNDYMYFSRASRYTFDQQIFSTTSTIGTSDRNKKKDFKAFDERYEKFFFALLPQLFKFIDGTSDRFHSGFISQDLEMALQEVGLDSKEFAGFCKEQKRKVIIDTDEEYREELVFDEEGNPVYDYMIREGEFIALNTYMLQKAYARIQNQDEEIEKLKRKSEEQEERIAKLERVLQEAGLM